MRRRKEKEIPSNANDDNTTTGSRAANTKENGTLLSEPPYDDLDFPRWGYLIILCVLLITFSPVIIHFLLLSPRLVSQGIFLNSILNWPLPYAGSLTKLGDTLSGVQNVRTEVPESRGEFLRGYRIIADDDFIPPSDTVELVDKWFFPAALPLPQASKTASRCAILFFHGNGSNRGLGWRIKHARALSSLSLPCGNLGAKEDGEHDNNVVFAYDVRCFGDSYCPKGAVLDEAGVRSDALTIYKDISNDFDQVYVYGHSLGTAIGSALVADACEFIDECKIKGLILDSPFTSLDVVATVHPFMLPLRAFVGASYYAERIQHIQFNTKETLARFITKKSRRQDNRNFPILIMHGTKDLEIPFKSPASGRQLFASLKDAWIRGYSSYSIYNNHQEEILPQVVFESFESGHEFIHRSDRFSTVIKEWAYNIKQ